MTLLRKTCNWLRNIFVTLVWYLRQFKNENFRNYIIKSTRDKNLSVLANGPSLKSLLNNQERMGSVLKNDVMMLNDSPISDAFEAVKPKYYIVADPAYWVDGHETLTVREPVLNALTQKTTWPLTFLVPFGALKQFDFKTRFDSNPNITVIPYHAIPFRGSTNYAHKLYKRGLSMPPVQNVVVAALFNSINLGYDRIDVYGVENSWTSQMCVDEQNRVCQYNKHFYSDQVELKPWLTTSGEPYKMHVILRDLANMFDSYHKVQSYAVDQNCKIVNKTKGSFIDAFDRE